LEISNRNGKKGRGFGCVFKNENLVRKILEWVVVSVLVGVLSVGWGKRVDSAANLALLCSYLVEGRVVSLNDVMSDLSKA
jgi:hypothetical protein